MIDKEHIVNFLRSNGVSSASSDDEIRHALQNARWHNDDIEVALLKLKDSEEPYEIKSGDAQNIFFSDVPIAPETLSSLLGIDVSLPLARLQAEESRRALQDKTTTTVILLTILTSVILGVFMTLLIMYLNNIGPFYSPVENSLF